MSKEDAAAFLRENKQSGYPAVKFEKLGDGVTGTVEMTKVVTTRDGEKVLLIDLIDQHGDGRALWVRAGAMAQAIANAAPEGIEAGGVLSIVFNEERDTGKQSPLKLYEASYEAPTAKADVSAIFGDA